jgi:hypothetical protein
MDEMLNMWIENRKGVARSDNGESRYWVAREVEAHLVLQMAQPSEREHHHGGWCSQKNVTCQLAIGDMEITFRQNTCSN